ncbi:DUF58 domain-containing protein [Pseudogemmobacter sp. W21_MBD1_M6]|uniref:DUF58 domain-containing protein n=1 Tax=Pseudogemmobacter sp. W21_MBD1_M6 TaxID=3240271 RepID=UPI003F97D973
MTYPAGLRHDAEGLASALPPLLAEAQHMATTVVLGEHGRRRAGMGDEFWQYRPAMQGDEARMIDWRRSGRSDVHFVREKEWQASQTVLLWVNGAQSMRFSSDTSLPTKAARARVLAMAIAVLLVRGGERVGLASIAMPARSGKVQLLRLAAALSEDDDADFATPEPRGMLPQSRALFISDFLGDMGPMYTAMGKAADRGIKGAILQVLDPQEEAFPFDGRTVFESMGNTVRFETLKAGHLRDRYLQRLAERKAELADLARATGWQYRCHHTNDPAQSALLWLYGALGRVR